jgi:CRP/FNR family cyclic AMP-dependent transcriptional regulator
MMMELVSRMMDGSLPYDIGMLPESAGRDAPLRRDAKMDRLQEIPIFQACTERQLTALARIAEVVEAPAGKVLARAGEPGQEFFLIMDGTAHVEVSPKKQLRLGPGAFFGEMSLIDGGPRSATVVAETALRLLVINRRNFATLLTQIPDLTLSLLEVLSKRVRQAERALAP